MNNEPVVWKAYEEVHFNDQYILRWVREGDEYVNKITKEMMEDLKSVVRQQQAELDRAVELYTDKAMENEALKQIIDANNLNQNIGQFIKPTNKPVAWTDGKGNYFDKNSFFPVDDLIPLYTHPVKELTDEEIHELANEHLRTQNQDGAKVVLGLEDFARAILRKAQENERK